MVSTLDFESSDPGSNPGRSLFLCAAQRIDVVERWGCVKCVNDAEIVPRGER